MNELNLFQLGIAFCFSLLFVLMFSLQKLMDNEHYFGFRELVFGYRETITMKAIFIKVLCIITFSVVVLLLTKDKAIVLISVFGGSFLIVWPAIIDKRMEDYRIAHKRLLLISIYIAFIILSTAIAYFSIFLFYDYSVMDLVINIITAGILGYIFYLLNKVADKEIQVSNNND